MDKVRADCGGLLNVADKEAKVNRSRSPPGRPRTSSSSRTTRASCRPGRAVQALAQGQEEGRIGELPPDRKRLHGGTRRRGQRRPRDTRGGEVASRFGGAGDRSRPYVAWVRATARHCRLLHAPDVHPAHASATAASRPSPCPRRPCKSPAPPQPARGLQKHIRLWFVLAVSSAVTTTGNQSSTPIWARVFSTMRRCPPEATAMGPFPAGRAPPARLFDGPDFADLALECQRLVAHQRGYVDSRGSPPPRRTARSRSCPWACRPWRRNGLQESRCRGAARPPAKPGSGGMVSAKVPSQSKMSA